MADRDFRAGAQRYAPLVALLVVVSFMFWVRMLPVDRVITDSAVLFGGNDAWYHKRMTHYAVQYFPRTTPFDPWSNFPFGTGRHSGFGGLFDQLVAFGALVVGLGNPSDRLVNVSLAIAPAVFGALTAVPTYAIGARLTDRWGGLLAAVFLALSSGGILYRTVVGAADHQSAEALFGAVAVAGFAYALATAYRERPTVEDVRDRNWAILRAPVLASVIGGVAVASYLMTWPPGVMLLFTFGVFVLLQAVREHLAGRSTDSLAIGTAVSMSTAGVVTLLYARTLSLESTAFSLLQPLVAFGVAAGALVLVGLSRYAEREGYDRRYYPAAVAGLIAASFVLMWLVFPRGIEMFRSLVVRVYSFGLLTSTEAGTVVEIQPATLGSASSAFGALFGLAVAGFALLAYGIARENRPIAFLVALWSLSMFAAYFTMARFGYYFAVTVALLSSYAVWRIVTRLADVDLSLAGSREGDAYKTLGVLLVLLLVVPGTVVATSNRQPVWDQAERMGGTDGAWVESMDWMQSNTPEIPLGYYERYDRPADGDFDYPRGAYGVVSWWDYGHWITVMGHRIPYTNPFQEGPGPASAYLQAENETRANLLLDVLPSASENPSAVSEASTAELRDVAADQPTQLERENGKYVVVDDEMAGYKFSAITRWTGSSTSAYFERETHEIENQTATLTEPSDSYWETMLADLYYGDARGLSHHRLVHEVDRYSVVGGAVQPSGSQPLTNVQLRGGWSSVDGLASDVGAAKERGDAVEVDPDLYVYDAEVESQVKIYERVAGARLTGTVPNASEGATVTAGVQLRTQTGRTFTYLQQATTGPNGTFEMTVPYATNDDVAPEDGGTNASVRAISDYRIAVGDPSEPAAEGSATVPEPAIYDGDTVEVQIETAG